MHTHTHTRMSLTDTHTSETDRQTDRHTLHGERERHTHTHTHTDFSHTHYLCNRSNFSASNLSSSGRSHGRSLFTDEEHKKAGSWCKRHWCQTCRPWSWPQRQSHRLSAHGCLFFVLFLDFQILLQVFKKKKKCIPFLWIGPMVYLCLISPLNWVLDHWKDS